MTGKLFFNIPGLILALLISFPGPTPAAESPFDQAMEFQRQDFLEDAIASWKTALDSPLDKRRTVIARIMLSQAYFKLNRFAEAIKEARALASADPENYDAQFNLANLLAGIRRFDQAAPAFEKALNLRPEKGLAYVGLALSLYGQGNREGAIAQLWKVKKLFKKQKNISWHRDTQLMIAQMKHFAKFPPHFADLWLTNNLKIVKNTYEKDAFKP